MLSILKHTLITATRDWLYLGLFLILALAASISILLGSTALVEQQQTTMVYIAGSIRMITIIGLILFVCFHTRRMFENREIQFILSQAISRNKFILSYWASFVVVAFAIIIPLLIFIALIASTADKMGLIYWGVSLILETSLVITFALVVSLILKSATSSVLACFGFYLISRMMGFFVMNIPVPTSLTDIRGIMGIMKATLKALSTIFPRLDLFGNSEWLLYGIGDNYEKISLVLAQSLIYIVLMLLIAFYDFRRKQF